MAAILDLVIEISGFGICCYNFPWCRGLKSLALLCRRSTTTHAYPAHTKTGPLSPSAWRIKQNQYIHLNKPTKISLCDPELSFFRNPLKAATKAANNPNDKERKEKEDRARRYECKMTVQDQEYRFFYS